jgi:hypothetical protein
MLKGAINSGRYYLNRVAPVPKRLCAPPAPPPNKKYTVESDMPSLPTTTQKALWGLVRFKYPFKGQVADGSRRNSLQYACAYTRAIYITGESIEWWHRAPGEMLNTNVFSLHLKCEKKSREFTLHVYCLKG